MFLTLDLVEVFFKQYGLQEKTGYDVNKHALEYLKEFGIKPCYNLSEIKKIKVITIGR